MAEELKIIVGRFQDGTRESALPNCSAFNSLSDSFIPTNSRPRLKASRRRGFIISEGLKAGAPCCPRQDPAVPKVLPISTVTIFVGVLSSMCEGGLHVRSVPDAWLADGPRTSATKSAPTAPVSSGASSSGDPDFSLK